MEWRKRRAGFTLIEMAVVLVIIGLIVGGILVGRSLVRQSEISRMMTDKEKLLSAANTFRGKYDCLPGDCLNATTYFGRAAGTQTSGPDSSCYTALNGTVPGTCNGNGNGLLDAYIASYVGYQENVLLWQHLSLAKLVPGSYNGMLYSNTYNNGVVPGQNIPEGPMPGTGWVLSWEDRASSYGPANPLTRLKLGNYSTTNLPPGLAVLTQAEVFALDRKSDDGMPYTGTILGYSGWVESPDYSNDGLFAPTASSRWFADPLSSSHGSYRSYKPCLFYFAVSF